MKSEYPKIPKIQTQIECLDCVEGMRRLPSESVDIVVTSPPYNIGKEYNKYLDRKSQQDYLDWCCEWIGQIHRILKSDGSFFLNLGSSLINPTIPHELLFSILKEEQGGKGRCEFLLQNTLHWIKAITVIDDAGNEFSKGHFKPINSNRFVNDCHEYIFHLTKNGNVSLDRLSIGVPYKHKSNIARWEGNDGSDKRCRGNTWFIPYKTIKNRQKERPHPATFPPELPENCILLHGNTKDAVVLDPFLGLGNSWIAATRNNVKKFIGFDIDQYYVDEATKFAADPQHVFGNDHLPTLDEAKSFLG